MRLKIKWRFTMHLNVLIRKKVPHAIHERSTFQYRTYGCFCFFKNEIKRHNWQCNTALKLRKSSYQHWKYIRNIKDKYIYMWQREDNLRRWVRDRGQARTDNILISSVGFVNTLQIYYHYLKNILAIKYRHIYMLLFIILCRTSFNSLF